MTYKKEHGPTLIHVSHVSRFTIKANLTNILLHTAHCCVLEKKYSCGAENLVVNSFVLNNVFSGIEYWTACFEIVLWDFSLSIMKGCISSLEFSFCWLSPLILAHFQIISISLPMFLICLRFYEIVATMWTTYLCIDILHAEIFYFYVGFVGVLFYGFTSLDVGQHWGDYNNY